MRKESTPIELLMESIRNTNPRTSLRKTGGPPRRTLSECELKADLSGFFFKCSILVNRLNSNSSVESSRTRIMDDDDEERDDNDEDHKGRRKVTLDPGLLDDLLNFSDEDESSDQDEEYSKKGSLDSIFSASGSSWNLNNNKDVPPSETSPEKVARFGHQRRHSLTVCETPKRVNPDVTSSKPRKPPDLVFSTQISTVSTISTASSGSVTPTSDPTTPTFEGCQSPELPALSKSSMAQMQARLHAEFLQSVR